MQTISIMIGMLGLIATMSGSYLAYVTYISPMTRFKWYLKKPDMWEIINKDEHTKVLRYKKQAGFQISVDWTKTLVEGFKESWMKKYPDTENNSSYYVVLEANGIFLERELFVTLDGGRGFVPVPKRKGRGLDKEPSHYYTQIQIQLSRIIGQFPLENNIEDFVSVQKLPIEIIK